MSVSTAYERLTREEFMALAAELGGAWQDPSIPLQQRAVADAELAKLRQGEVIPVFGVLLDLVRASGATGDVLEIGCASGYYSEVLRAGGWRGRYFGVDYSESLIDLAKHCHPESIFVARDATDLGDMGPFDLVISAACLMHVPRWQQAVAEAVRVAKGPVIFHRTTIDSSGETTYWRKEAYGVPCLELHFGEAEMLQTFTQNGLQVVTYRDSSVASDYTMRSYLCRQVAR